ncbi:MAG: 2Fe-2S iron-sulfur cluster-binding protein [Eubacterium sp.]
MEILINGKTCACEKGEFLLAIAERNGIKIPTLCHHPGLSEQGCCRLCIVEVVENERSKVVVSCVYPVEHPCSVLTESKKIKKERGVILALLKARAPESALIKKLCDEYGSYQTARLLSVEGEKCILCGLCTRACKALGTGAISTINRGVTKKVSTPYEKPSWDCIACTSCAQVCPTEAIPWSQDNEYRFIWGRNFALAKCFKCGTIIGTKAEILYASQKSGVESEMVCEHCRQKEMADILAHTYGIE